MTEQELQQYFIKQYPKEDEGCEWKEFKNLKNDFSGHEKDDVISYVSALKKQGVIKLTEKKKWVLVELLVGV